MNSDRREEMDLVVPEWVYTSMEYELHTPDNIKEKYREDYKFFLSLREVVKYSYSDDLKYEDFEPQVQKLVDKHITTEGEIHVLTEQVNIFDKKLMEAEVEKLAGKAAIADHIASKTVKTINLKMNEDPVFFKKLSQLIKETIDAYHAGRLTEVEYLNKTKGYENDFNNRRQDGLPDELVGKDILIAFFNQSNTILENALKPKDNKADISLAITKGIDTTIRSLIFDRGNLIVDWQNNTDLEGKLRIALDDFLFDSKVEFTLDMPNENIDQLIDECLKIAKVRYQ